MKVVCGWIILSLENFIGYYKASFQLNNVRIKFMKFMSAYLNMKCVVLFNFFQTKISGVKTVIPKIDSVRRLLPLVKQCHTCSNIFIPIMILL